MNQKVITGAILADKLSDESERPAVERVMQGEPVPFSVMEEHYKKPGGTMMHALFGADPLDFWVGRFYVGTFGVMSLIGIFFGTFFYLYQAIVVEGAYNLLAARLDPPPISAGLRLVGANEPGFYWQLIVFFATIAFIGWALRQVDISRKLEMTYEIPIAYGAVVFSWITLQILRPIGMGAWGNGFALGITHHLDWVSNIGYQYFNFFYNPFHAIGISLLFASTLVLAMHGSIILMSADRPFMKERQEDAFWRNLLGYSIGEIGIHRMAFWLGVSSVLFSNLCIYLSGTLVYDWNEFWSFWNNLPFWSTTAISATGITFGIAAFGVVIWRGRKGKQIDVDDIEFGGIGLEGTAIKKPIQVNFLQRLFGLGQVGPVYLGLWGTVSVIAGVACAFIILEDYAFQVAYNPVAFLRDFWVLSLDPPGMAFGLGFAPWHEGGAWIVATFLLHVSVLTWLARVVDRSQKSDLGMQLAWGFGAALFLYFVIYLIRPMVMGNWAQAPGHGFKAILDWTNNVSVQYGNFYYNPFHMLSIFFLLGSTLLLAMHGATIVATSRWGAHREIEQMMAEGSGYHRSQLFWRWCMGFQATSKSIHQWLWWFAAMTGITGGIGLLISGTLIFDWYAWATQIGIVAPPF
ncbi:MAG: photosynthetic reaction center subunit M [Chloroflexi bacterium]|nr:photosynthetic reaction center subunit M [Chloroflexota bacterium]